jgi:predicted metal-binding protein
VSRRVDRARQALKGFATGLGASAASIIDAGAIVVKEELAGLCEEPRCPSYGQSASCPPHVAGPRGFREMLERFSEALVVKLDVPTECLLGDARTEVFQLLHEIVSKVEAEAARRGRPEARGFAGGGCKRLFCPVEPDCQVLVQGRCRHPYLARPSMSGNGVDVSKLVESAGWTMIRADSSTDPETTPLSPLVGLVLLG